MLKNLREGDVFPDFELPDEQGVMHRLSDLLAAGNAGSEQVALAKGLLSDTETRIVYAQPDGELAATARTRWCSSSAEASTARASGSTTASYSSSASGAVSSRASSSPSSRTTSTTPSS